MPQSEVNSAETQGWINVPVTLKLVLGRNKFKVFFRGGASAGFIVSDQADLRRNSTQLNNAPEFTGPKVDLISQRNGFNLSAIVGVGITYKLGYGFLILDARYKYGLMNIRVISKQALFYGLVVGSIGGTIVLLEYINRSITDYYANFPLWVLPAFSVLLVMIITLIIWRKIHEIELIRSEFITTVTHKFRTPLTQIKWSAESLMKEVVTPEGKEQLSFIQTADTKLVELTNLLVKISEAESDVYNYHLKRVNIKSIIEEVLAGLTSLISNKKINIQSGCNICLLYTSPSPRD